MREEKGAGGSSNDGGGDSDGHVESRLKGRKEKEHEI